MHAILVMLKPLKEFQNSVIFYQNIIKTLLDNEFIATGLKFYIFIFYENVMRLLNNKIVIFPRT